MIAKPRSALRPVRLVAIGFALGSVEHLIRLVLHVFHIEVVAGYPAWRDAAFALVDASIACLGFTRPHRLFVPVLAFLIEQIVVNGSAAWRTWRVSGEILWMIPVMIVLIGTGAVIALRERRKGPTSDHTAVHIAVSGR